MIKGIIKSAIIEENCGKILFNYSIPAKNRNRLYEAMNNLVKLLIENLQNEPNSNKSVEKHGETL